MKKNLVTVPSGIQHYKPYVLRLSSVFLLLLFCNLQISAAVTDSATTAQDQNTVIYISSGAKVIGASEFSNASIVELPAVHRAASASQRKVAQTPVLKPTDAGKAARDRAAKHIQQNLNRKIKDFYTSNPQDNGRVRLAKSRPGSAAVSGNLHYQFPKAVFSAVSSSIFAWKISARGFYHSRSHLQSIKFTCSSLRGPPVQL